MQTLDLLQNRASRRALRARHRASRRALRARQGLISCVLAMAVLLASGSACNSDVDYVDPALFVEVGIPDTDVFFATQQVILPTRLEQPVELDVRNQLSADLGGVVVPYIRLEDISVAIEWTVRNLSDTPGTARVHVNGGNEQFYYVPLNFVVDPEEDEEPPPLIGDIPIDVPALGTVSGVFREDQVYEASVDLELITRGGLNPFAAVLEQHDDIIEAVDPATGAVVPKEAWGFMVQYDISLEANRHMVLEFTIRVRDHRGLMHDMLLDAPAGEFTTFTPVEFVPPPPPPVP